jgi:hypothetical protein
MAARRRFSRHLIWLARSNPRSLANILYQWYRRLFLTASRQSVQNNILSTATRAVTLFMPHKNYFQPLALKIVEKELALISKIRPTASNSPNATYLVRWECRGHSQQQHHAMESFSTF